MARNNFKLDRVKQSLMVELNDIINDELNDIEHVSITDVELTKDLVDAKVYIQTLSGDEEVAINKLTKASGYLKKRLAEELDIRKIPNLIFKYDHSLDNYNKIEELLKK